jgi:hypothetical protein
MKYSGISTDHSLYCRILSLKQRRKTNPMIRTFLTAILAIAGAMSLFVSEAKADSLGVDFSSPPSIEVVSSIDNLGYSFKVVNGVTVTGLADFDNGSLANLPQDQQVGLWDSSGDLLASAYVGADQGSTQQGAWGVTSISGVTLIAGDTYTVGAQGGMGFNFTTPLNVNSNIDNLADAYTIVGNSNNSPLVEPTSTDGAYTAYLGGNVQLSSAPEPASFLLLAPALGGLFMLRKGISQTSAK